MYISTTSATFHGNLISLLSLLHYGVGKFEGAFGSRRSFVCWFSGGEIQWGEVTRSHEDLRDPKETPTSQSPSSTFALVNPPFHVRTRTVTWEKLLNRDKSELQCVSWTQFNGTIKAFLLFRSLIMQNCKIRKYQWRMLNKFINIK